MHVSFNSKILTHKCRSQDHIARYVTDFDKLCADSTRRSEAKPAVAALDVGKKSAAIATVSACSRTSACATISGCVSMAHMLATATVLLVWY